MYVGNDLMIGYNSMRSLFEQGLEILNDSELEDAAKLEKLEKLFAKAVLPATTSVAHKSVKQLR